MDYTKSNMLSIDLNEIYEAELHNLVQENEVLRVQNETLKLQLITKDKQWKVLQEEFKQLKKTNIDGSRVLCSVDALSKGLDMVKIKHISEIEKMCGELSKAKRKLENITNAIYRERSLRILAETDRQEAIEIAEELFLIIEKLQKKAVESTLNTQVLKPSQPVLRAEQKTIKEEHLLEGLYHALDELHDASEIKKHISSTEASISSLRGRTIQSQPQRRAKLRTEAKNLNLKQGGSHGSKKLHFPHRYI